MIAKKSKGKLIAVMRIVLSAYYSTSLNYLFVSVSFSTLT